MQVKTKLFIKDLITLMIPLVFLFVGISGLIKDISFKKNGAEAVAVIESIETNRQGKSKSHTIYISYAVNGTVYYERCGYYYSGMKVGGEINIYYDRDNPKEFILDKGTFIYTIVTVAGAIGIVVVGTSTINGIKKRRIKEETNVLSEEEY